VISHEIKEQAFELAAFYADQNTVAVVQKFLDFRSGIGNGLIEVFLLMGEPRRRTCQPAVLAVHIH